MTTIYLNIPRLTYQTSHALATVVINMLAFCAGDPG